MCHYHRRLYHERLRHSRYAPTNSLLHNAGAICALMWRRARRVRGLELGAERAATDVMYVVMKYAERVFSEWRAEEEWGVEVGFDEIWEENEDVFLAGEEFCVAIGDGEAAERVRDVLEKVLDSETWDQEQQYDKDEDYGQEDKEMYDGMDHNNEYYRRDSYW